MYVYHCLWAAFLIWTTTQLSLIASVASEKNETTLLFLFYSVPHRGGAFVNLRWKICGMQNLNALLKLTTTPMKKKRSAAS